VELEGTIGEFSLRELIEMIVYSSVTGVLEVGDGDSAGHIFFRDGLPYDASAAGLTGFDAAALLFESQGVAFRFEADTVSQAETLWMDPLELIERCEERARVWAQLRPYIPGLEWIPALRANSVADQVHISEVTWPVLSSVDGQRSVADIALHLAMAPVDVCNGLVALLKQKLIVMLPPRPEPELPPEPGAAQETSAEGGGFFERLIAKTLEEERRRTSDPSIERISDPNGARIGQE
jgi:hypothetical protein